MYNGECRKAFPHRFITLIFVCKFPMLYIISYYPHGMIYIKLLMVKINVITNQL